MTQRGFTFINLTGNPVCRDHQDEDLPTIRSHAMREVRRRKELTAVTSAQSRTELRPFKIGKNGNRTPYSIYAPQSLKVSPSRAFSNPYSGTAIELADLPTDFPRLLSYFIHGFTPLTFPTSHVRHECDILRIAMYGGSPALLHALCAVSAVHQALVPVITTWDGSRVVCEDKRDIGRAFLYHKQRAVTLLRTKLSKSVDVQTHSTLAIVTLLLIIESLSGDTATASAHKSGLLALAKRCDREKKPSYLMISDVLMSDIKSATSSLSLPSVKPSDAWVFAFDKLKHRPFVPHRPDLVSLGSGFTATKVSRHLEPSFVRLMCAMRNLINDVEHSFDSGASASEIDGTHFLVLEHQLLSLPSLPGGDDEVGILGGQLTECCRIGALLYCNLFLWSWPKMATLVDNLLSHLRTAISQFTPDPEAWEQRQVLLWLYVVGCFASSNDKDCQWYREGMKNASDWLDIQGEDHLRSVLSNFFYVDRLMGQQLKVLPQRDTYQTIK